MKLVVETNNFSPSFVFYCIGKVSFHKLLFTFLYITTLLINIIYNLLVFSIYIFIFCHISEFYITLFVSHLVLVEFSVFVIFGNKS